MSVAVALLIASTVAMLVVAVRRLSLPVWVSVVVALGLRALFAALTSRRYTPNDVKSYFHSTGQMILAGQDPALHLPGREWNFLQLMPYVHAAETKLGLPWVYAVKVAPIAADVVVVWLIAVISSRNGRSRALQYALNPVSLLVVSLHGQVEPVALAFALGGVALVQRQRYAWAGVVLGAAVAAKTWPIVVVLAVAPLTRPRKLVQLAIGTAMVPIMMVTSGVIFLDTAVAKELRHVLSYTSFVGNWTWSGALVASNHATGGYDTALGRVGSVAVAAGLAISLVALRRHPVEVRVAAALSVPLIFTAGFGVQYLLWPVPILFVVGKRWHLVFTMAAATWAAIFYFNVLPTAHVDSYLSAFSWVVVITLIAALWEASVAGGSHRRAVRSREQIAAGDPLAALAHWAERRNGERAGAKHLPESGSAGRLGWVAPS